MLWLIGSFPFRAPEEWENELGVAEALQDIMQITRSKKGKVDWNEVLRICNRHFDSVLAAHRIKSRDARTRRLEEIANQTEAKLDGVRMDWLSFVDRDLFFKKVTERASPKERAPLIAALFITTFDMSKSCAAVHDRGQCVADQARLALALAGFRAENGKYPDRLVELVPKYISPIPDDMYSEKPFVYRREGSAYVLKSVGPNGKEETERYPLDDYTIATDLNVPVRDKGMMLSLRELGVESKFGSIDFSDTQVADVDLAQLADVAELYSLTLSGCNITDAGLKHLKDIPSLTSLYVNDTPIGDAGLAQLAGCHCWLVQQCRITQPCSLLGEPAVAPSVVS